MQKSILNFFTKIPNNKTNDQKDNLQAVNQEEKCSSSNGTNKIKEEHVNKKINLNKDQKLEENVTNKIKEENVNKQINLNKDKKLKENVIYDNDFGDSSMKSYKRLKVLSDDEDNVIENSEPIPVNKKMKITDDKSPNKNEKMKNDFFSNIKNKISESTPQKKTNIKEEKSLTKSTKSLLSSFSKNANESNAELNTTQFADSVNVDDGIETYEHFTYEFLKKENIRDSQRRRPDHSDYDSTSLFVPESFMSKLTPGLKQWWKIKANGNMETIILFKVGKFYELYHMDAIIAVNELGLSYMRGNYAHSGFPEIAFAKMTDQLVLKGYKVARVEQTETVEAMNERVRHETSKNKVVNREICQVITPGTRGFSLRNRTCREIGQEGSEEMGYIDDTGGLLYAFKEAIIDDNYQGKLKYTANIGVAVVNTNTGKFTISQFSDDDQRTRFRTMISRFPPNEIIYLKGNLSKTTQYVFNSSLAATKKECLTNNKQFLSSDDTLSRLLSSDYFMETPANKLSQFGLPIGLNEALSKNDNLGRTASQEYELAVCCIGALLYYLEKCLIDKYLVSIADFNIYIPTDGCTSRKLASNDAKPFYNHQSHMIIDSNTLTNLDILKNNSVGGVDGTLLERLDFSSTAFGRRQLIQWIATPLCDPDMIFERQEAIKELIEMDAKLNPIKSFLKTCPDLEKLIAKIHVLGMTKSVTDHPDSRAVLYEGLLYSRRKITDFVITLSAFDGIVKMQNKFSKMHSEENVKSNLLKKLLLQQTDAEIGEFPDIEETINFFQNAFDQEKAKKDGKIIPEIGVDADYDETMESIKEIEECLSHYLEKQKILLNCNITYFGTGKNRFQMEIKESHCSRVPQTYIASSQRKGFKRYLTVEIENFLSKLISAEEKRDLALKNIMSKIFAKFDEHYFQWTQVISSIAQFDALLSLANFSRGLDGGPMTRPEIRSINSEVKPFLVITEGRYPCKAKTQSGEFISNTIKLGSLLSYVNDDVHNPVMLLTGPNMGGKSTLMRQTALIIILSQLGCYVPAEGPVILTPVDRLFTRQGANDAIGFGQSTLQVEMNEAALILSNMTSHSFLLVDELGRGTATYDGCALAFSILKGISDSLSPRTIFSTHFHKLLEEKEIATKLQISHMACMVEDDDVSTFDNLRIQNITFLYKLTEGGCPKSYGFNAARLANIPEQIILNGLKKARLFEEETLILEFRKFLEDKSITLNALKMWQTRFKKLFGK